MSHPCKSDPRPIYHADYTHTMQSDTLLKIRNALMAIDSLGEWETRRLARINAVLGERGINTKAKAMRPTEPKPNPRITKSELDEARTQAAKFLAK